MPDKPADKYDVMREVDRFLSERQPIHRKGIGDSIYALRIRSTADNAHLYLVEFDQRNGIEPEIIPTREEFEDLVVALQKFYDEMGDESIENYNKQIVTDHFSQKLSVNPSPLKAIPANKIRPGYVYVLESGGRYKIGQTKDFEVRFKTLGKASPYPVNVISTTKVRDMTQAERHLHDIFFGKRINGEWFNLDEADLTSIQHYLKPFTDAE